MSRITGGKAYLQACTIEEVLIVADVGEVLRNLAARRQEHAIGHFPINTCQACCYMRRQEAIHNVSLVDGSDPIAAMSLSVMERIASNSLRRVPGDQLDGLHDTVDNLTRT